MGMYGIPLLVLQFALLLPSRIASAATDACSAANDTTGNNLIQLRGSEELRKVNRLSSLEITQRKMPDARANRPIEQVGCPWDTAGLKTFPAGAVVTLSEGKYLLNKPATLRMLTIGSGAELVFADTQGVMLTSQSIVVQGKLSLGAEQCPLLSHGVGVTLTGSKRTGFERDESKGLVVKRGGVLAMHGKPYSPTWTRLDSTVQPGGRELVLQDVVDWQAGQQVVVVTTAWTDEVSDHQNEVRTIQAIGSNGRSLTLDQPLRFGHYGGSEYQAEVALLSRNIVVQGDAQSEEQSFGGHVMCGPESSCQVSAVRGFRLGQLNVMGKYPFHFHMMGDARGSYFQDVVVQRSYFRAFTIHGTSNVRLSRNVAFDVIGSAYYLEDGVEEGNLLEFNLGAFVHIIKPDAACKPFGGSCGGQPGFTYRTERDRIVPVDATAFVFYNTNANNHWVGNSASGGFIGFGFPCVPAALGKSRGSPIKPCQRPLGEFDSNTAHSSGRFGSFGACIYVGGQLTADASDPPQYTYITGRVRPGGGREAGRFVFTNTKVAVCNRGMQWWGRATGIDYTFGLENYEAHDVIRSSQQLGDTYMSRAVVSAHTGNRFAEDLPAASTGFEMYDTGALTILDDVTFRNFDRPRDVCLQDLTFSNTMKMTGMFRGHDLAFENVPEAKRFSHQQRLACQSPGPPSSHRAQCGTGNTCTRTCPGLSGASALSNMLFSDGASVGWSLGPAILGSDDASYGRREWWHADEKCVHREDWGFWACPTLGHREVVSLYILKGIYASAPTVNSPTRSYDPGLVAGPVYHFGRRDRFVDLGFGGNHQITGICCDIGWYAHLNGGAERELSIYLEQMVPQGGLVFATSYPNGATFQVRRCFGRGRCTAVTQAASLKDVLDAPGTKYFVDQNGVLFLKLVDAENSYKHLEPHGFKQLRHGNTRRNHHYWVRSSKSGQVGFSLPAPLGDASGPPTTPAPQPEPTPAPEPRPEPVPVPAPSPDAGLCKPWCTRGRQAPCSNVNCAGCDECTAEG